MSAASINANQIAKDLLANLKSGVRLKGTVRRRPNGASTRIAWIGIDLPAIGERIVLVRDDRNLPPGRSVVIQCIPNPAKPERYIFQLARDRELALGA